MSKIAPRSAAQLAATVPTVECEPVQRRGKNRKRTDAEIEHQGRVAELGCIVCRMLGGYQQWHTELHHVRNGKLRADCHFDVLPLCFEHHRHNIYGIHGQRVGLKEIGKTQEELLEIVKNLLEST